MEEKRQKMLALESQRQMAVTQNQDNNNTQPHVGGQIVHVSVSVVQYHVDGHTYTLYRNFLHPVLRTVGKLYQFVTPDVSELRSNKFDMGGLKNDFCFRYKIYNR